MKNGKFQNILKDYNSSYFCKSGEVYIEIYQFDNQEKAEKEYKKIKKSKKVFDAGITGPYIFLVYSDVLSDQRYVSSIVANLAGEE